MKRKTVLIVLKRPPPPSPQGQGQGQGQSISPGRLAVKSFPIKREILKAVLGLYFKLLLPGH